MTVEQVKLETLDEVLTQWKTDSTIDNSRLEIASLNASKLHSRYLQIMQNHNLRIRKLDRSYDSLYKDKWQYYSG